MNKFGVIYVFLGLCLTKVLGMDAEMQELIDNLHKTCVGETGTTDDLIANARKGDFSDNENFKCYFKCIFDQMGCMNDDGTVDSEAVVALMPPELANKVGGVIRGCTQTGSGACDNAWLANKCYYAGDPENYFVP